MLVEDLLDEDLSVVMRERGREGVRERFINDFAQGSHGLVPPSLTVTLEVRHGSRVKERTWAQKVSKRVHSDMRELCCATHGHDWLIDIAFSRNATRNGIRARVAGSISILCSTW